VLAVVRVNRRQVQSPITDDDFPKFPCGSLLVANFDAVLVSDGDADIIPTEGDLSVARVRMLCKDDLPVAIVAILPNKPSLVGDGGNPVVAIVGETH